MAETLDEETKKTSEEVADPAYILSMTKVAKTLTISDQHANILLTTTTAAGGKKNTEGPEDTEEKHSILKLTLVPVHKPDLLPPLSITTAEQESEGISSDNQLFTDAVKIEDDEKHSQKVLSFLSQFSWKLNSESGAEYSYYEAFPQKAVPEEGEDIVERTTKKPKLSVIKGKSSTLAVPDGQTKSIFKAELIYPASDRQIARAMPNSGFAMITETPSIYQAVTKPFIDAIVASGSLSWLQNIVQVKKEKERLLFNSTENAPGWILNIDTKWRSHPDAMTVPREEWYNHKSTADLYCLGVFKEDGVASLRDLTGKHLPILKEVLKEGPKTIEQIYGIPREQLRIFVHYPPQFYHFHVHFTRLDNETGVQVERAHLLSDIIQNLETDPAYYQKRSIDYKLSFKDQLYQLLKAHKDGDDDDGGEGEH